MTLNQDSKKKLSVQHPIEMMDTAESANNSWWVHRCDPPLSQLGMWSAWKTFRYWAINLSEAKMSVNKEFIKAKQGQKLKSSINDSICISYKMSEMKPE